MIYIFFRLNDMISLKQKLSRQIRDQENEMDDQKAKLDSLKQDLRKSEKHQRNLQTNLDEALSDSSKQSKLRERAELYCQELEQEIEAHKQHMIGKI